MYMAFENPKKNTNKQTYHLHKTVCRKCTVNRLLYSKAPRAIVIVNCTNVCHQTVSLNLTDISQRLCCFILPVYSFTAEQSK